MSLTGAQIRAARALARWSAAELARAAKLGRITVTRAEHVDGRPSLTEANLDAIRRALEAAGVVFTAARAGEGPGVRLRHDNRVPARSHGPDAEQQAAAEGARTRMPSHHTATVDGGRVHWVMAGHGEPVVLLHGWPETSHAWRKVIPLLAPHHLVVAPDLPGCGGSEPHPEGGRKRALARRVHALVARHLGLGRILLVGHDKGMATAYAYAAQFRDGVRRLVLMDADLSAFEQEERLGLRDPRAEWHVAFHLAPAGIPEMLVAGREGEYLSWFWRCLACDATAIEPEAVAHYIAAYSQPGTFATSLGLYRSVFQDREDNAAWSREKLPMPVLAVTGAASPGNHLEATARRIANDVRRTVIEQAGYWIAEEQPAALARELLAFFGDP